MSNGIPEKLKPVSLHFTRRRTAGWVSHGANSSSDSTVTHQKTKKIHEKLKASEKKEKKTKSHYKVYFLLLCGSLKKQIAFQYFINKWVCEQWPSDGSIVSEPNSRMPQARQSPCWLHFSSRESAKKKSLCAREKERKPPWRTASLCLTVYCFVRALYLW